MSLILKYKECCVSVDSVEGKCIIFCDRSSVSCPKLNRKASLDESCFEEISL